MPNAWAMIDTSFPTFTGEERYRDQVTALQNYLYLVVEELKYQLANLNTQNWNRVALQQFQKETTAETDEQVIALQEQISRITNRLNALSASLSQLAQQMEDTQTVLEEIPRLWEGLELLGSDVDDLKEILKPDGSGGAVIGKEGEDLRLIGNVYINGILIEQEG